MHMDWLFIPRKLEGDKIQLRSEAEAPWRSLRLVLYGFSVASAGVATLISIPQLIGAAAGAPGALQLIDVLQNLAINIGAVAIFAFLFSRDWKVSLWHDMCTRRAKTSTW
eukprot:GHRR01022369.1.p1 GENE.GHRR01022369.1~~GHRR01022369.1.p1  ORF type:complete len:110 (+),score=18.68 GHRR01022369.1:672-1001(+)